MNKKGASLMMSNVVFPLFFIAFSVLMVLFISGYKDKAVIVEDFYAKEIALMINRAGAGTEIKIDVSRISEIAVDNGKKVSDIVKIDNVNNNVIVSLRDGQGSSYGFFNDVDILYSPVEQISGKAEANRFIFKVVKKQRQDVQA